MLPETSNGMSNEVVNEGWRVSSACCSSAVALVAGWDVLPIRARVTSPIGKGIFSQVVVTLPGGGNSYIVARNAMTIDQGIEPVLGNKICQWPASDALVAIDEDMIYSKYQHGGILT